jgi:hypothetical protein
MIFTDLLNPSLVHALAGFERIEDGQFLSEALPLAGPPDAFQKRISILNLPCAGMREGRRALVYAWA